MVIEKVTAYRDGKGNLHENRNDALSSDLGEVLKFHDGTTPGLVLRNLIIKHRVKVIDILKQMDPEEGGAIDTMQFSRRPMTQSD